MSKSGCGKIVREISRKMYWCWLSIIPDAIENPMGLAVM